MGNRRNKDSSSITLPSENAIVVASGRPGGRWCLCLLLPEPPSVNHIWRHGRNGRMYRESRYKNWLDQLSLAFTIDRNNGNLRGFSPSWPVTIFLLTSGRKDVDNCIKPVVDGLVHVGLMKDDDAEYVRAIFATKTWFDIPEKHLVCLLVDRIHSYDVLANGLPHQVLDWLESAAHLAFRSRETKNG